MILISSITHKNGGVNKMNKRQSIKLKYARINYNICDDNYIEDLASYFTKKH